MDVGVTGEGLERDSTSPETILEQFRIRADEAVSAWAPIHEDAMLNVRMQSGDQWDEAAKTDRQDPNCPRPMLTLNQLPKYVRRVLGDAKQNRISIKVRPIEPDRGPRVSNVAGTKDYSAAELREGIISNIEYTSKAERAYDTGLEHAVTGGFGWLRVIKRYSTPDGFQQELAIRAVRNRYSVMMDPSAMFADEPDMASAQYALVSQWMRADDLKKRYGKDVRDDAPFDTGRTIHPEWWTSGDRRRIAEYFWRETESTSYLLLSDQRVIETPPRKSEAELAAWLDQNQLQVVRERKGEKTVVRWALSTFSQIIDGPYVWDGGYIPIIPVLGPEMQVGDRMIYAALTRDSLDAQRMHNYWWTSATEIVAAAPKAPWVAEASSVGPYIKDYRTSMRRPIPVLLYDGSENVHPPRREPLGGGSGAEIALALNANDAIKSTIGIFDASLGARSNETSGRAIDARAAEADTGTFAWHDAIAKAVERVGVILLDLIPHVMDTQQVARLRFPEDSEDEVVINQLISTPDGGTIKVGDLASPRCDAVVKTGPSFATRRAEAAAAMMEFIKINPAAAPAVGDLVAAASDWPQADSFTKRLRKMVPRELLEPSELAEIEASAAPPDPQAQAQQQAQVAIQAAETGAAVTTAQAKEIEAKAKLAEAQAVAPEQVKELIAEALAEVLPDLLRSMNESR